MFRPPGGSGATYLELPFGDIIRQLLPPPLIAFNKSVIFHTNPAIDRWRCRPNRRAN